MFGSYIKLQIYLQRHNNDPNKHDVVKRQSEQNCQCKDGTPGPRGPPGNKGEMGIKGLKGDTGSQDKEVMLEIEDHEE